MAGNNGINAGDLHEMSVDIEMREDDFEMQLL
jgi:hypothetical protein